MLVVLLFAVWGNEMFCSDLLPLVAPMESVAGFSLPSSGRWGSSRTGPQGWGTYESSQNRNCRN